MGDSTSETIQFDEMAWIPPVECVENLPMRELRDGTLCYANREDSIYRDHNGIWIKRANIAHDR